MARQSTLLSLWEKTIPPDQDIAALSPHASYRSRPIEVTTTPLPGDRNFEIRSEIGRGGMGIVYRARQTTLGRDVAVKKMRPEYVRSSALMRQFAAEAMVAAVLEHPNIAPIHDLGSDANGEIFMAMKLVGGMSWHDLLHPTTDASRERARGYDLERHLETLVAVGNAVGFAHSKNIIHRDIKPENVMVGEFGEVLLMDWGLTIDCGPESPDRSWLRRNSDSTTPEGTPAYMAPELACGDGVRQGPWTDIYLLGAVLHEILIGRAPHGNGSFGEALMSAFDSVKRNYADDVPPELARIAQRAMAREPEDRFKTVEEFQAALRLYLRHKEAIEIAKDADQRLDRCRTTLEEEGRSNFSEIQRRSLYSDCGESIAGFKQALVLWPEYEVAKKGIVDARVIHAESALRCGDFGLAESIADSLDRRTCPVPSIFERIADAKAKDALFRKRSRLFFRGLVAAGIVIVCGATLWTFQAQRAQIEIQTNYDLFVETADHALIRENIRAAHQDFWPRDDAVVEPMRSWLVRARELRARVVANHLRLERSRSRTNARDDRTDESEYDDRRARRIDETFANLGSLDGAIEKVERNLRYALSRRKIAIDDNFVKWRECIADIRSSPKYRGLILEPQDDLIPLRKDPGSGLWEFYYGGIKNLHAPKIGENDRHVMDEWIGIVFVLLPGDHYRPLGTVGASSAAIRLDPVFVSKYELTIFQWSFMVDEDPDFDDDPSYNRYGVTVWEDRATNRAEVVTGLHPVNQVTWEQSTRLLARYGLTLPTEVQWEYAARAGSDSIYGIADDAHPGKFGNIHDEMGVEVASKNTPPWPGVNDGWGDTAPIGTYLPNAFGLHDTFGNVSEWCADLGGRSNLSLPRDGDGLRPFPLDFTRDRVYRGASINEYGEYARVDRPQYHMSHFFLKSLGLRPTRPVNRIAAVDRDH